MSKYINSILKKYTKIIAWGTGNLYTIYKELLDERLIYFVDNDSKKWGGLLGKKKIFSPEKLKKENVNDTLIIICNNFFDEISIQIKQYGDFDILDIMTFDLVQKKEKGILSAEWPEGSRSIVVCGGIHAMWLTNGSRKFITGQLEQLHCVGFHTIEVVPLLFYLAGRRESAFLAVSINGAYQGLFSADELAGINPKVRGMIVHSLYYSQSTMKTLADFINVEKRILYYIHDYFCLCSQRFLYKGRKPCVNSNGILICDTCNMNIERQKLHDFHYNVFKKHNVLLVAPSEDTRIRVKLFYKDIEIVEFQHLEYEQEFFKKQVNCPIRIAYIGSAIWQKGWEQFARMVSRFHEKYEFYCLGHCTDEHKISNVKYISIGLKESGILTMTEALLQYHIDIAYIGSVWPETYSYTYYEAYEAGCFVITNTISGNIYRQVMLNQNGISFSNDSEMFEWLEKDTVYDYVLHADRRIINVRNSEKFLKCFE